MSLYCGIPSYRYIVTTLYRTQKYLFQDAKKKNETVQFNLFIFNEMVKVYFHLLSSVQFHFLHLEKNISEFCSPLCLCLFNFSVCETNDPLNLLY